MRNIQICVISFVHLIGRPAGRLSCVAKTYIGHYTQTFPPKLFVPTMLIGTSDFYHFIQLLVISTLTAKLVGLIFLHAFQLVRKENDPLIWCGVETV